MESQKCLALGSSSSVQTLVVSHETVFFTDDSNEFLLHTILVYVSAWSYTFSLSVLFCRQYPLDVRQAGKI